MWPLFVPEASYVTTLSHPHEIKNLPLCYPVLFDASHRIPILMHANLYIVSIICIFLKKNSRKAVFIFVYVNNNLYTTHCLFLVNKALLFGFIPIVCLSVIKNFIWNILAWKGVYTVDVCWSSHNTPREEKVKALCISLNSDNLTILTLKS